jgi:hypothetical protein
LPLAKAKKFLFTFLHERLPNEGIIRERAAKAVAEQTG